MIVNNTEKKYKLKSCVWEITLACSFSCKYCGSKGGKARENELTTIECLDIANQLSDLGCQRVSLIGGEVFMRHDWNKIVRRLTDKAIKVSIITNGFIMSDKLINDMKTAGIESVAVSLDGTKEAHDKNRQEGSFVRAQHAIWKLIQSDIPVSVITTLNAENVQHLEALYQMLCEWPIYAWQLQACSPMGNAVKRGINYRFNPMEVIRFVQNHMFTAPFIIGVADNIGYYTEMEGYLRGNLSGHGVFPGCRAGLNVIGIDSVGNVRGCESMYDEYFIEGNLREKSLREIWESPDAFKYNRLFRREMLTGKCGRCKYGFFCAGGCRSYNFFVHNKLYESPLCAGGKMAPEGE